MQLNPHSFDAAGLNDGTQSRVHEVGSRNLQIGDALNDLGLMEEVGERLRYQETSQTARVPVRLAF